MPKSLWNAEARQELLDRLARLKPDARQLWGGMNAPQMLAHLVDWMQMAKGELRTKENGFPAISDGEAACHLLASLSEGSPYRAGAHWQRGV